MTFLESAKKVYPDVALLLNKIQLLALDKDPNEPFTDQVWQAGVTVLHYVVRIARARILCKKQRIYASKCND